MEAITSAMKERKAQTTAQSIIHIFFGLLSIATVIPLILVISISLTDEQSLLNDGYQLFPKVFSAVAYEIIIKNPGQILKAYGITIFVTVCGTLAGLFLTAMVGYGISRRDYRYRRITTLYIFFTMLFSGGLVPFYMLVTQYLHLKDTIGALIMPYLLNPFYILIMKGFLEKIPAEIFESAKIDGAKEFNIFFRFVLPLSTPALATIGLFISFTYWNDWWLSLLFIDNPNMVPLQLLLYRIMSNIEFISSHINMITVQLDMSKFPTLSVRMAMAVLAAGPMMVVFPFFQKYFVKGLTVGSLKG